MTPDPAEKTERARQPAPAPPVGGVLGSPDRGNDVPYVIAYDIAHPKRLRRVARLLERRGVRCQYSVFLFRGTAAELTALLDELAGLIRPAEDVVQAWPVPPGIAPEEHARG